MREGADGGPYTSRDIVEMRSFLRLQNREQAWAYVEKKKKELYLRIAVKKLDEEDDEFADLNPWEQLQKVVERAKLIAMKMANDENEFVAMDAEGHVLDEEGKPDPDAESPSAPARFGDGTAAEIGESRQKGRFAETAKPKTFGR